MNVIVSNKQKEILDNANIDAIKDLNGLFNVEDLINNFKNYFFTKMILDATSVVEFANPDVLKKLTNGIGAEKLVILLPESPEPPKKFLEMLVELGIYNFSTKIDEIVNLLQNPNTYDDVKVYLGVKFDDVSQLQNTVNNNDISIDNNINSTNMVSDEIKGINFNNGNAYNNLNSSNMFNNINLIDTNNINSNFNSIENNYNDDNKNMNFSQNINNIQSINGSVSQTDFPKSSESHQFNSENNNYNNFNNKYILGVKNVTSEAGSTSLIYMLKQTLEYKFRKRVLAVELNSNDFLYFRDNNMISIPINKLDETISNNNYDVVLIDLNNTNYESLCTEVIYLVEPSILKLNKLMSENKKAFLNLNSKKVILNKCLLSNADVDVFSREAGFSFFFVIPPLNDRVGNSILETLINKLNINNSGEKRGFLGLFNKNS